MSELCEIDEMDLGMYEEAGRTIELCDDFALYFIFDCLHRRLRKKFVKNYTCLQIIENYEVHFF